MTKETRELVWAVAFARAVETLDAMSADWRFIMSGKGDGDADLGLARECRDKADRAVALLDKLRGK